jgi:hypothetical protein
MGLDMTMGGRFELLRSTGKNGQKRNISAAFGRLVIGNSATAQNGKWRVAA